MEEATSRKASMNIVAVNAYVHVKFVNIMHQGNKNMNFANAFKEDDKVEVGFNVLIVSVIFRVLYVMRISIFNGWWMDYELTHIIVC